MGVHSRAWGGVGHLIFSGEDLTPMKIEQSLAQASPANEIAFDSFEHYGDALEHCKERNDAGFFVIDETHSSLPVKDVFQNLSSAFEKASGFTAYGAIFHRGRESVEGYRLMVDEPRLLEYVSLDDLLDPRSAHDFLNNVWQKYVDRFEQHLVPDPLQKTYSKMAEVNGFGKEDQQFTARLTNLLANDLNLSWLDMQALRWVHMTRALNKGESKVMDANPRLANVCQLAEFPAADLSDPVATIKQDLTLPKRLAATVDLLNQARHGHQLEQTIDTVAKKAKPGQPILLRLLKRKKHQILAIGNEILESVKVGKVV